MLFRNPHCWFRQGMKALSANGEMHPATCGMPRAQRSRSPDRSYSGTTVGRLGVGLGDLFGVAVGVDAE